MAYKNPTRGNRRQGTAGNIATADLAANAVTTAKIAANAVGAGQTDLSLIQTAVVAVSNAEIKALRAAPKTLVAAPGANKFLEFVYATILLKAGANVLSETAANLAVKYQNGAGTQISETVEATGFIDQATDTLTTVRPKQDGIVATAVFANALLCLHNLGAGEYGANAAADATLRVFIAWRVWPTT